MKRSMKPGIAAASAAAILLTLTAAWAGPGPGQIPPVGPFNPPAGCGARTPGGGPIRARGEAPCAEERRPGSLREEGAPSYELLTWPQETPVAPAKRSRYSE